MRTLTEWLSVAAIAAALTLAAASWSDAAPPQAVPQGPPVWCYGQDDLGRCMLFLGTEHTCMNIDPCNTFASAETGEPFRFELWFCMGQDEFGRCQLFVGSQQSCMNIEPCSANIGRLPRLRAADGGVR